MMPGMPPAGFIDMAWWEVYGAPLRAERLTREAWIDALALAYRIVRMPASLDARQLAMQQDMVDRELGRKFYTNDSSRGVAAMTGWTKAILIVAGYLVVCYALGISPAAIPAGLIHGLETMHQQAVSGH